ncbi:MAG: hypothetical protein ACFIN6_00015 [Candidatus Walczuchella monophlebidarum]
MLATNTLNSIGHFTDWIISHVVTLVWNVFMGVIYWLVKRLYSTTLANIHFCMVMSLRFIVELLYKLRCGKNSIRT